ncbi:AAA family ATPase [Aestuariivirga litoralis]|uniref:AAA family ATPase n=1 Tax=Aestuariivirga litoralis TaxID=2650924 RepID=UPI0018C48BC9|nr:AAA family ATPase [Aestuariivirga litoralis]MBG1233728.1 AAA family ATPase [Aestuariivirga litoralis]
MNIHINPKSPQAAYPLQALSLDELLNKQFPKRDYLIEPVLKQGESMMLWAAPGVGKTMLALSFAVAVAGGGKVLGLSGTGGRRVLIIDGEMNEADLADRLRMLIPTIEGCDPAKARQNICIIARQAQRLETKFPDLGEEEGQKTVLDRAMAWKADLVILDNFSTLATLEDENSSSSMDPVLRFLMTMKQAGIGCILVHHSAKGGDKYRGSSKIATTFEVILGLKQPETLSQAHRASFDMEWTKFRSIRNDATRGKKAQLVEVPAESEGGEPRLKWEYELSESEEAHRVIAMLKEGRCSTQKELAAALGMSEPTLTRLKTKAIADRRIGAEEWRAYLDAAKESGTGYVPRSGHADF